MHYSVIQADRETFVESISHIQDKKSIGFANMSLAWWDKHFSWKAGGCVILIDEQKHHLCYLFYKIDRYHQYLTLHNLLTPLCHRRHGYAFMLLHWVFALAAEQHVSRFRATCVPQSLQFYLSLGFLYWGLTSSKDYYCNMPLPNEGLDGIHTMVANQSSKELAGTALQTIYDKTINNDHDLTAEQEAIHTSSKLKLLTAFRPEAILLSMAQKGLS